MQQALTSSPIDPTSGVPAVDAKRLLMHLVGSSFLALAFVAVASAGLILLSGRSGWWIGWVAALAISVVSTSASLAAVAPGLFGGAQSAAYGYLAGSLVRMLAALVCCIAAIWVARTPPLPTLLLTVPLYLAGLAIEAFVLGRAFWGRK